MFEDFEYGMMKYFYRKGSSFCTNCANCQKSRLDATILSWKIYVNGSLP